MSVSPVPVPVPVTAVLIESDCSDTLLDAFGQIADPRHARGLRHQLASVLALCVVAMLSGRQNLTQIHRYGKDHPDVLETLGGFHKRKSPVTSTLSTLLGSLQIGQLQEALAGWICSLFRTARAQASNEAAAVDGKTTRASKVHVLNVLVHDMRVAIMQCPVEKKANEITALRHVLTQLFEQYPFLKILTGDALFAGNPLCSEIIAHGRHYLFQVKGDQKHLLEKMELVFAPHLSRTPDPANLTGEKKTAMPSDAKFSRSIGKP